MKIIFLDLDGVITSDFYRELPRSPKSDFHDGDDDRIAYPNRRGIELLNMLVEETDAKIVVSSAWRIMGQEKLQRIFNKEGIKAEIIGCTPYYSKDFKSWLGERESTRGLEIKYWLDNTEYDIENFVIIDDEAFDISNMYAYNFVKTFMKDGFNYKAYYECLYILNNIKQTDDGTPEGFDIFGLHNDYYVIDLLKELQKYRDKYNNEFSKEDDLDE